MDEGAKDQRGGRSGQSRVSEGQRGGGGVWWGQLGSVGKALEDS